LDALPLMRLSFVPLRIRSEVIPKWPLIYLTVHPKT
jgi:hypothetical protein